MNFGAYLYKLRIICTKIFSTFTNKSRFILNGVSYGNCVYTYGNIFLRNAGSIVIGNNVNINSSMRANPVAMEKTTLFTCRNAIIQIGNNVGISNAIIYASKSIIIENGVVIGGGTKIFDTDFHSVVSDYRLNGNKAVNCAPVLLKEKCFIGADCTILKGVTVGKRSVVGAGSVVTKNIPDNQIWAGNPARYIKDVPEI